MIWVLITFNGGTLEEGMIMASNVIDKASEGMVALVQKKRGWKIPASFRDETGSFIEWSSQGYRTRTTTDLLSPQSAWWLVCRSHVLLWCRYEPKPDYHPFAWPEELP